MTPLIRRLTSILQEQRSLPSHPYMVPGVWVGADHPVAFSSAPQYLLHQLDVIDTAARSRKQRTWSIDHTVVYSCLVRHVTSYDHGEGATNDGWRTTGTFLKLIGLLPYLDHLGVDTICLLPITEVGKIGRKGTLGSPYAVRHPLHLEPTLAEPAVPMSVEDQARTFIECCHALGIKVVVETILRTASLDSELVPLNPQWFYWVDEARLMEQGGVLRAPSFTEEQLNEMQTKVDGRDFRHLPEPSTDYQELFSSPPLKIEVDEHGWKGIGAKNRILRIPGAFADWPADDPQPAWSDVTYLRLHDHPQYRYMAYNTLRMFERSLDDDQYRQYPLWNTISAVIPYYVRSLNVDGAMIDMGHALPRTLQRTVITEARKARPGLLLFEENFHLHKDSAEAGYDAAVGYLPFDAHQADKLIAFLRRIESTRVPIRFFATPETHNTPRAAVRCGDPDTVAHIWLLLRLLPGAVAFLHAGMELGERTPVNTGLEFTPEEIQEWTADRLPLFSDVPLRWDEGGSVVPYYRRSNAELQAMDVVKSMQPDDPIVVVTDDASYVGYVRILSDQRRGFLVIHDLTGLEQDHAIPLPETVRFVAAGVSYEKREHLLHITLKPRETRVISVAL